MLSNYLSCITVLECLFFFIWITILKGIPFAFLAKTCATALYQLKYTGKLCINSLILINSITNN